MDTLPAFCTDEDEALALACSTGSAWRVDTTLFVRTADSTLAFRTHVPADDGLDLREHTYVGTVRADPPYHVVLSRYYEMRDRHLVNGRTGRRVLIAGNPIVSPDRRRLVAAYAGMSVCEDDDTRLEIWRLTDSIAVREWQIEPWDCNSESGWGPGDPEWLSPDSVRFTRVARDDPPRAVVVVRAGESWRLIDSQP